MCFACECGKVYPAKMAEREINCSCGRVVAGVPVECPDRTIVSNPRGVGTLLKGGLSALGIRPSAKCRCEEHARMMDRRGVEWCRENRGKIVRWMQEEAEASGLHWSPALALGAYAALEAALLAATVMQ